MKSLAPLGVRSSQGTSRLPTLVADLAAEATTVRAAVVGVLLTVERHGPAADLEPGGGAQQGRVYRCAVDPGVARTAEADHHELIGSVVSHLGLERVQSGQPNVA